MNESKTRKEIIDFCLLQAGWNPSDRTQVVKELIVNVNLSGVHEPESSYANSFSDYALLGKDGKVLAVIEAKKSSKDFQVLAQVTSNQLPLTTEKSLLSIIK